MAVFQYHPEILEAYPNLIGGVILASDLQNGPTPEALKRAYDAEQQALTGQMPAMDALNQAQTVIDGIFNQ